MSGFRKCINCFLLTADALQSSDNFFFIIPLDPHIFTAPYTFAILQSQSIFNRSVTLGDEKCHRVSNLFAHNHGACSRTELNEDRSLSYFLNPWKPNCSWLSRAEKGGWEDISNSQSKFDRKHMTKKVKKLTVISLQIQERLSNAKISSWVIYIAKKEENVEKVIIKK